MKGNSAQSKKEKKGSAVSTAGTPKHDPPPPARDSEKPPALTSSPPIITALGSHTHTSLGCSSQGVGLDSKGLPGVQWEEPTAWK